MAATSTPLSADIAAAISHPSMARAALTFAAVLAISIVFNLAARLAKPPEDRPPKRAVLFLATPLLSLSAVPLVWAGYAGSYFVGLTPWGGLRLIPFVALWTGVFLLFWALEFVQRTNIHGTLWEFNIRGSAVFVSGAAFYFTFAAFTTAQLLP